MEHIWAHKQPNRNYDYSLAAHDRTWRRILIGDVTENIIFSFFCTFLFSLHF